MSRIGKEPVKLADGVTATVDGQKVTVPLSGGFALVKTISPDGGRFTIRVAQP